MLVQWCFKYDLRFDNGNCFFVGAKELSKGSFVCDGRICVESMLYASGRAVGSEVATFLNADSSGLDLFLSGLVEGATGRALGPTDRRTLGAMLLVLSSGTT